VLNSLPEANTLAYRTKNVNKKQLEFLNRLAPKKLLIIGQIFMLILMMPKLFIARLDFDKKKKKNSVLFFGRSRQ
jgi:hypothetical protein